MLKFLFSLWVVSMVSLFNTEAFSQVSMGGTPPGFSPEIARQAVEYRTFKAPDYDALHREDDSASSLGIPERMGVAVTSDLSPDNSGTWTYLNSNTKLWRLNLKVDQAVGLGLYFSKFHLAPGDLLYVYSADKTHVIGAFTSLNNKRSKLFATEVVKGESIIVELVENEANIEKSQIVISDILVVYTPMTFSFFLNPAEADTCEVNINCAEGDNWQNQANGVVRIMIRNGNAAYWCTGSLLNNTALNFASLMLTADHCACSNGRYAIPSDLQQWIIYFKHVSKTCTDNTPYGTRSMSGAEKLASSSPNGNNGSDFYLIRLLEAIPNDYQPFFLGWNAQNESSNSGVSIHHPDGDVKKISTYTSPLLYSQWGDVPETHFKVTWSRTENGYGVTEGGSSGSPLFNNSGLVIGQLTGGQSDCTHQSSPDYYGRFYFSWDMNGEDDSVQLKPWLDPINSGLKMLSGSYNTKTAIAQFTSDQTVIPVGSSVEFYDLSINSPDSWEWEFEGGYPATAHISNPGLISYNKLGTYSVRLVVGNEYGKDTTTLEDYIRVVPVVYPNPTRNIVHMLFGQGNSQHDVTITDSMGRVITNVQIPENITTYDWSFRNRPSGLYIVQIKSGNNVEHYKIIFTP